MTRRVDTFICPVRRAAFSTGYIFNYNCLHKPLYVRPKYGSLKEEMMNSGFMGQAIWNNVVMVKVRQYMSNVDAIRMMTVGQRNTHFQSFVGMNAHQMRRGDPVTMQHLCANILYCDSTDLCTAFSATFRLQNVFESIESLVSRHSEFAIWTKLLMQMVLEFGTNGNPNARSHSGIKMEHERGPFFCGVNCAMNFGSFAITLKGPCSTSTVGTVALNFATEKGIIIKLNNDEYAGQHQCFLDCSFISNYTEESERLWFAGSEPLRMVTIIVVNNKKNYESAIHAMYLFDAMISAVKILGKKSEYVQETQEDYELLSELINIKSGRSVVRCHFDSYILKEWSLFLNTKKEIILDLEMMNKRFPLLSKLILFNLTKFKRNEAAKGMDNVFKAEWLSMFTQPITVRIRCVYVSKLRGHYLFNHYKFRMESLLDILPLVPDTVTIIVEDPGKTGEWIQNVLTDQLVDSYKAIGWNIECTQDRVINPFVVPMLATRGLQKRPNHRLVITYCET